MVLPFDLFPSPLEDPGGVGREWGVEGVVGRCVWGDSAPIDIGEAAGETGGRRGEERGGGRGRRRKREAQENKVSLPNKSKLHLHCS